MKTALAALILLPAFALAQTENATKPAARPGYQTINLGEPPKDLPGEGLQVTTSTNCETDAGQKIKQGDAGFDACMVNNTQKNTRSREMQRLRKQKTGN